MFKYLLKQIWGNIYIRLSLLFFSILVIFSLLIKNRISIANKIDSFLKGQVFDNPSSWNKGPYGYVANEKQALKLLQKGLANTVDYALDLYNIDYDDDYFTKEKVKNKERLKNIPQRALDNLLSDMQLYCEPLAGEKSFRKEWQQTEKLKKRKLKNQKGKLYNPFKYALNKDKYEKTLSELLSNDFEYFSLAQNKKPDSIAIMQIRSKIYHAICRNGHIPKFWKIGLDYREYIIERNVYRVLNKKYKDTDIEKSKLFSILRTEKLERDDKYQQLLLMFFSGAMQVSTNLLFKINIAWNSYLVKGEKKYLISYIRQLLIYARTRGQKENLKFYKHLFRLKNHRIESYPLYIYALAETAYRSKKINESERLLRQVLYTGLKTTHEIKKNAKRLLFMISLQKK